jgi:hypothetical protein
MRFSVLERGAEALANKRERERAREKHQKSSFSRRFFAFQCMRKLKRPTLFLINSVLLLDFNAKLEAKVCVCVCGFFKILFAWAVN